MASVHPKPSQVSSLSPQVTLEEGCTTGRQADKVISHYPNKQGPNGHLKNSLTAHSQEATKKQERALETQGNDLVASGINPSLCVCVCVCVCVCACGRAYWLYLERGEARTCQRKRCLLNTAQAYLRALRRRVCPGATCLGENPGLP